MRLLSEKKKLLVLARLRARREDHWSVFCFQVLVAGGPANNGNSSTNKRNSEKKQSQKGREKLASTSSQGDQMPEAHERKEREKERERESLMRTTQMTKAAVRELQR